MDNNIPKIFANRVINQVIHHLVAEDMVIEPKDYKALREVFRKCGGSWEKFVSGDQIHIELLKTIVGTWGQMPGRVKESNRVI